MFTVDGERDDTFYTRESAAVPRPLTAALVRSTFESIRSAMTTAIAGLDRDSRAAAQRVPTAARPLGPRSSAPFAGSMPEFFLDHARRVAPVLLGDLEYRAFRGWLR